MVNSVKLNRSRKLILEILERVEKQNSYLNILLPSFYNRYKPNDPDKALMQEISYGVTRFKKRLDWIIAQYLTSRIKKIPLTVQNILRMGAYQILYLEKIPAYAIVNESVELVKDSSYSTYSGMVNAILRNISRKSVLVSWPDIESEPVRYISVFYSYPEWLVERWMKRFGLEICLAICQAGNEKPDFALRINSLRISQEQFQRKLSELKIPFQKSLYLPQCAITIKDHYNIVNMPFFQDGLFSIQDESSMLASEFLMPGAGETVFDMCSGPGGKTTHMAQIMGNKGKIVSFENNRRRLEMVMAESRRLGIKIVSPVLADSRRLNNEYLEKADKILLDAPCSGSGVIRKKPDLKWKKWNKEHLRKLNQIQKELLDTAARYLRWGGELLYATCSMEREENDGIILNFIKEYSHFTIQDSSQFVEKNGIVKYKTEIEGAIQLIPGYSGANIDGFYMVKLKKGK